jgi:hypothetical protein
MTDPSIRNAPHFSALARTAADLRRAFEPLRRAAREYQEAGDRTARALRRALEPWDRMARALARVAAEDERRRRVGGALLALAREDMAEWEEYATLHGIDTGWLSLPRFTEAAPAPLRAIDVRPSPN